MPESNQGFTGGSYPAGGLPICSPFLKITAVDIARTPPRSNGTMELMAYVTPLSPASTVTIVITTMKEAPAIQGRPNSWLVTDPAPEIMADNAPNRKNVVTRSRKRERVLPAACLRTGWWEAALVCLPISMQANPNKKKPMTATTTAGIPNGPNRPKN